jgi:hypothetical protein
MRALMVVIGGGALALLAACGGHRQLEMDAEGELVASRWSATLSTPTALAGAMQIRGRGWWAEQRGEPTRSQAHVEITNAVPGGDHPWHVHQGQCGSNGAIVGPATAYRSLEVNKDGRAMATTDLPVAMPRTGQYHVNVHASANNMGTIIACGNLAPPVR